MPNNASEGYYDVMIYDSGFNNWITLEDGFYVNQAPEPEIDYVSPNTANLGEELNVYISGSNFNFYGYSSSEYPLLQFIHSDYSNTNSFFTGNIYSGGSSYVYAQLDIPNDINEGYYDVEIFDLVNNDWITLEDGFYLQQGPMIESITPNIGYQGESLDVNISGINITLEDYSSSGTSQLWFYHSDYSNTYFSFWGGYAYDVSENEAWFNVNIPWYADEGMYNVEVYDYNSNNYIWLNDGFEVVVNENPCLFWDIDFYDSQTLFTFEEYDDDLINIQSCPGNFSAYAYNSNFSSDYLYWGDEIPFSELSIHNDTLLALIYNDEDTSCIIQHYNFDIFDSIENVADITIIPNSVSYTHLTLPTIE